MAAPSYTHDLTDLIADSDTTAWTELAGATAGGAPDEVDTESALQGTNSCSQITNSTSLCSLIRILGASVTLSAGNVFLVWHGHGVATALNTYANGGLRLAVATDINNFKAWAIGGSDVAPFPYAKWVNNPIDPTVAADYTTGTPPTGGTNIFGVGSMCLLTQAVARGQPHIVDIIRYGRAEARFANGDLANGFATFSGFATLNDAQTARWGLIQETTGGYLWKGLMTLGFSAAVDFRDSNKTIFVQDCRKVTSTFNKIEIRQATSRVDWTGISFVCLSPSTNASKGSLEVIDNADVNLDTCSFTDMGTFVFLSNGQINDSIFRRCQLVTQGGAAFDNCIFDSTTDATKAVLSNNPANITNCQFISSGTKHALELNTAGTYSFVGNTFSGYGANGTTDAAIYNNSGGAITLNITNGDTPTVRNGAGATTTIVSSITVTLTGLKNPSEVRVFEAGTTTEVAGTGAEDVTDGDHTFSLSSGQAVDIVILALGYQNMRILNYSSAISATIPISQILDRQYENP